jgi:hypothetical protein
LGWDGRVYVRGTDHEFSGSEKASYDSLPAAGRSYYDELRWFEGLSNSAAFELALAKHGLRKTV